MATAITRSLLVVAACAALGGCNSPAANYCGNACGVNAPCATGYICDGSTGTCVATDGHCASTTGGASSSGTAGSSTGASSGGSSTGGSSGGGSSTSGGVSSTSGGSGGLIPVGGPYSLGSSFADQGTLACGGSLSPSQTGSQFSNQGILGSRGAGPVMHGQLFQSQGGFLGQ